MPKKNIKLLNTLQASKAAWNAKCKLAKVHN